METGQFRLYGAFCDPSDQFCAEDGDVTSGVLAAANYSATVTGVVATPEPSQVGLMLALAGIGLVFVMRRREGRSNY